MDIVPQLFVNSLITGSIYALASAGLVFVYGVLRVFNFAHGHLLMAGAYLFYLAFEVLQWGVFPALLLTTVLMTILALFSLRWFVLPFTRQGIILTFVTTLCLGTLLESAVSIGFGVNVKSFQRLGALSSIEISGVFITPLQIGIIVFSVLLLSLLAFFLHSTAFGRRMRAVSENPAAAQALGVSYKRTTHLVFVLATLSAMCAGIAIGLETNLQPTMGQGYTIKAFAAMILGGLGSMWGAIAGSFFLGLIENFSIGLDFFGVSLPAGYKDAFAYGAILFVLLFFPAGLFGSKEREV